MSNHFVGRGNLGATPELKQVTVEGEPRTVTELRIYFDRQVPDGNGGFEDRGGFWLPVQLWGPRGESVAKLLPKGARVRVEGTLVHDTWEDKDGETVSRIEVQAETVDLDLSRVEAVTFPAKGQAENGPSAEPQSQAKRQPDAAFPLRETSQARDIARVLGAIQKAERRLRGPIAPLRRPARRSPEDPRPAGRYLAQFTIAGWRIGHAWRSEFAVGHCCRHRTRDTPCASKSPPP